MPLPSSDYLKKIAAERVFSEIHEIVRDFKVRIEEKGLEIRVIVSRYYFENEYCYHLSYSQTNVDGEEISYDYGQVLTGSEDEESTIRTAISFIRKAHKLY